MQNEGYKIGSRKIEVPAFLFVYKKQ